jgi:LmbE family N-acetylglucosaminyl deacetylase|tara:strand:- start:6766 stop:7530 length:765 start_codon:yes stop_codon:yes gene_type:complete
MSSTQKLNGKGLLAIFAHPDDELFIAPLLSRYSEEGVDCYLAIVTDGRFGITAHMNGLEGDELADLRRRELIGAAQELSIHPPIMLDFADGFSHKTTDLQVALANTARLYSEVVKLVEKIRPSALITFGPDGIYGHPDHTAVGNVVTMAFQASAPDDQNQLFYPGICIQDFPELFSEDSDVADRMLYGLDESLLPLRIAFSPEHSEAAHRSLSCHQSQFTQPRIDSMIELFHRHGQIRLRPWNGRHNSTDSLFG